MTWRLAAAIKTLQAEVNAAHPDRPKQADGTIGDARHQAEKSDHNPTAPHVGVVTAWDITTAPFTIALAEKLRLMGKAGDHRVKYVIYRGRIASTVEGWAWRAYSGFSQHFDHIHLSVSDDPVQYDRTDRWGVFDTVTAHASTAPSPIVEEPDMRIIHSPSHSYARLPGLLKLDPKTTLPIYRDKLKVPVVELSDADWMAVANAEKAAS